MPSLASIVRPRLASSRGSKNEVLAVWKQNPRELNVVLTELELKNLLTLIVALTSEVIVDTLRNDLINLLKILLSQLCLQCQQLLLDQQQQTDQGSKHKINKVKQCFHLSTPTLTRIKV